MRGREKNVLKCGSSVSERGGGGKGPIIARAAKKKRKAGGIGEVFSIIKRKRGNQLFLEREGFAKVAPKRGKARNFEGEVVPRRHQKRMKSQHRVSRS